MILPLMANKKTVVSEVASAFGAAAARVENLKPKRSAGLKHSKAPVAVPEAAALVPVLPEQRQIAHEEIAQVAFLYWEARGFQGGSQEEDWLCAEHEVLNRRRA